jgi:chaperonin GroEL
VTAARRWRDIAVLTGGHAITEEEGRKLDGVTIDDLGRADKVISTKDDTTIVGGRGEDAEIKGRMEQIKVEIEKSTSDYDKEKLQERLAKLSGGVALINAITALDKVKMGYPDEQTGVKILREALEMPMRKIAANAGQDGAVILDSVRRVQKEKKNDHIGYDVMTGEYVDMVEAGIIDPAKVTKGALSNAASIAAMIRSTEALMTDIPEKEKPAPAAPHKY